MPRAGPGVTFALGLTAVAFVSGCGAGGSPVATPPAIGPLLRQLARDEERGSARAKWGLMFCGFRYLGGRPSGVPRTMFAADKRRAERQLLGK